MRVCDFTLCVVYMYVCYVCLYVCMSVCLCVGVFVCLCVCLYIIRVVYEGFKGIIFPF